MRLAPAIIFASSVEEVAELARETTRLTHGSNEALFSVKSLHVNCLGGRLVEIMRNISIHWTLPERM